MRLSALFATVFLGLSASLAAGEPPPETPLLLPPPAVLNPQWGRIGRYSVWQNYSVDHLGRWRPRVLYTPDGAFYYYDGRPFPETTIPPLEWMPYASD
jgi:hypothetical protein